jgi:hypothetical protein
VCSCSRPPHYTYLWHVGLLCPCWITCTFGRRYDKRLMVLKGNFASKSGFYLNVRQIWGSMRVSMFSLEQSELRRDIKKIWQWAFQVPSTIASSLPTDEKNNASAFEGHPWGTLTQMIGGFASRSGLMIHDMTMSPNHQRFSRPFVSLPSFPSLFLLFSLSQLV